MFSYFEMMSFHSWWTQPLLAKEVEKCAYLIPQSILSNQAVSLLFKIARECTLPIRNASMPSRIHVISYVPDLRLNNYILKHFQLKEDNSHVYWMRLASIDSAEYAYWVSFLPLFTAFSVIKPSGCETTVVNLRLCILKILQTVAPVWSQQTALHDLADHLCGDGYWKLSNEARELGVILHQRDEKLQNSVSNSRWNNNRSSNKGYL